MDGSEDTGSDARPETRLRSAYEVPLERLNESLMDQIARVAQQLQAQFGADVWMDHSFKPFAPATELAIPVVDEVEVTSWEEESLLLNTWPPLGFARVYCKNNRELLDAVHSKAHEPLAPSPRQRRSPSRGCGGGVTCCRNVAMPSSWSWN